MRFKRCSPQLFPLSSSSLLNTFLSFCLSLYSSLTGFPSPLSLYCQSLPQALLASLNCLCCWHDPNPDTLPSPRSQGSQPPFPSKPSSKLFLPEGPRRPALGCPTWLYFSLPKVLVVVILDGCPGAAARDPQETERSMPRAAILPARCSFSFTSFLAPSLVPMTQRKLMTSC